MVFGKYNTANIKKNASGINLEAFIIFCAAQDRPQLSQFGGCGFRQF